MSMTLYVILSLGDVPNTNELNETALELGIPITYEKNIELKEQSGFLPATFDQNQSGVEIYFSTLVEYSDYFPSFDSSAFSDPVVITFRWGGRLDEMLVALHSANMLSYKINSKIFDGESGEFMTTDQVKLIIDAVSE